MDMTVVYFILFGKDCQAVFRSDDSQMNVFTEALEADDCKYAKVTLNEKGEVLHG